MFIGWLCTKDKKYTVGKVVGKRTSSYYNDYKQIHTYFVSIQYVLKTGEVQCKEVEVDESLHVKLIDNDVFYVSL